MPFKFFLALSLLLSYGTMRADTCLPTAYVGGFGNHSLNTIDLTTDTIVLPSIDLTGGIMPTGLAITPDGNTALIANFGVSQVAVVDLTTSPPTFLYNIALPPMSTGSQGLTITNTPFGLRALIANNLSNNISVIDLTTIPFIPLANVSLGGGANPSLIATTPDGKYAYVANQGTNNVTQINLQTNPPTFVTNIALPGGSLQTTGIAITPGGDAAYEPIQLNF